MTGIMSDEPMPERSVSGRIRAFLRWWREELVALLPPLLRQPLQYREQQLVFAFGDDGVQVINCQRGQTESSVLITPGPQGMISQADEAQLSRLRQRAVGRVVLRLSSEDVLSLSFPLPLEAEKNLHEVLGYELGRHAPFKIEQVYYDYTVLERRREEKQIWLSVVVVPRQQVDPLLTLMRGWGFVPAIVSINEPSPGPVEACDVAPLNLLPLVQRAQALGSMHLAARMLTLSATVLLVALIAYPLLVQELHIAELQAQVDAVKSEAVNVQSMQRELQRVATESAFVAEKKQRVPEALDVLNALTLMLPDDTWLEHFEMKGNRMRIQGLSADASSLIELMENSPLLQRVEFDSPIVRDPRIERFRFQIVAELAAGGG